MYSIRFFLYNFNGIWIFSTNFLKILKFLILWKSVHWEPSCSMQADINFANVSKRLFDFLVIIMYSCSVSVTLPNALHKYTLLISIKHTRITTFITQYSFCLLEFTHLWCFLIAQYLILQKARYCYCQYFAKLIGRNRSIYVIRIYKIF